MPKGVPNKGYTPEFKVMVIETMRKEELRYCEAAREFEASSDTRIASLARIYLSEGAEGFRVERWLPLSLRGGVVYAPTGENVALLGRKF